MTDYYVGLMSGTSMDGIDAVVASFGDGTVDICAAQTSPYPYALRDELLAAIRQPLNVELDKTGELHRQVGECFRDAALAVINSSGVAKVRAIGSHGQTIRHQPNATTPISIQIGDAELIAGASGVPTVANFRQADIDVGGQGAPLVPPFHHWLFAKANEPQVVVNMGGFANLTILPGGGAEPTGFDTGPGNGLMDLWTRSHLGQNYDNAGRWAQSGDVIPQLFEQMLGDDYFSTPAPKSTGFEYFNRGWLETFHVDKFPAVDVQATLCELTAASIAQPIVELHDAVRTIFVCGGGVHNKYLMQRLRKLLAPTVVSTTAAAGLDPDWVEAVAFAWLAMRTMNGETGNLPSVTGASHKIVLGDIHSP